MIIMYVYFNNDGDIKSISPSDKLMHDPVLNIAPVKFSEVELLLTGDQNLFNYTVRAIRTQTDVSYTIIPKDAPCRFTKSFNQSVMEISENNYAAISIVNDITTKQLLCNITHPRLKLPPIIALYFTKKHDPYILITLKDLCIDDIKQHGAVCINYTEDLQDASLFVYSSSDNYSYTILEKDGI